MHSYIDQYSMMMNWSSNCLSNDLKDTQRPSVFATWGGNLLLFLCYFFVKIPKIIVWRYKMIKLQETTIPVIFPKISWKKFIWKIFMKKFLMVCIIILEKWSIGALARLIWRASLVPSAFGTISPSSKTRIVIPMEKIGIKKPIFSWNM